MPRAIWNGTVLAESDETIVVEGNHYFPRDAVDMDSLEESGSRTICPWKGVARYYTVVVDGRRNEDAAWHYPRPSLLARRIKGRIAFWRGVHVET